MLRVYTMETIPYPFSHLAKLNTVFARKNFCVKSTFDKLIGGKAYPPKQSAIPTQRSFSAILWV